MLTSGPHCSGPVASPASGVAAMIGTWSTSQVASRVLLGWPDNVTTFTQSRGWFRPLLRYKHLSTFGSDLWERCMRRNPGCIKARVLAGGSFPKCISYGDVKWGFAVVAVVLMQSFMNTAVSPL